MTIEAIGQGTSVRAATDVFATNDKDGKLIGKAKQTAEGKPSIWVSDGENNRMAGVVAKTTPTAQSLDDSLLHKELISGEDLRYQNGVTELN